MWRMQARNEELARKASKASEEDIKTLTDEYEARLGAAERKVYALSKERDMLKRGTEKLSSATETLKEKDNIIAQVRIRPPDRAACHCDTLWMRHQGMLAAWRRLTWPVSREGATL